jgi:outer membrane protein OmpA-like peptidoglycan-associated protein
MMRDQAISHHGWIASGGRTRAEVGWCGMLVLLCVESVPLVVDTQYVHGRQSMVKSKRVRCVVFHCAVLGAVALVAGCATKDWVNETVGAQEQALAKRVAQLEATLGQVNGQVGKLGTQLADTRAVADAANTKAGAVDNRVTRALANRFQREMVSKVDVQFTSGKYGLLPAHHTALNGVVKTLQDHPTYTADVVGYTDGEGQAQSNVVLSWNRAESVRRYLVEKGAPLNRFAFIGLGEDVTKGDVTKGPYVRAKDRQVTVLVYRPVE